METALAGEPSTESALIAGCRAGDSSAARELMGRHQVALVRTVVRLVRRREVADEIVQETFLRMLEHIDRIDPERGVRPWLFRVAINLARKSARQAARIDLSPGISDDAVPFFGAAASNPEKRLVAVQERAAFERAIAELSPRQREVALLRFVEGMPFREIARVFGLPVPLLKLRAKRAKARLVAMLGGRT